MRFGRCAGAGVVFHEKTLDSAHVGFVHQVENIQFAQTDKVGQVPLDGRARQPALGGDVVDTFAGLE